MTLSPTDKTKNPRSRVNHWQKVAIVKTVIN